MSLRIDTAELISGALVIGETGLGVLGSNIPSTGTDGAGYLYNDISLPSEAADEFYGLILTVPSDGTFFAYEDSSFTLTGAADGTYTFTYEGFKNGTSYGTAIGTCTIGGGSGVTGTLARTNANDTCAAVGKTTVLGTLARTNSNDTSAGAGTTTVLGTLARTNANDTCAGSGFTGSITGTLAVTNANDTSDGHGIGGPSTDGPVTYAPKKKKPIRRAVAKREKELEEVVEQAVAQIEAGPTLAEAESIVERVLKETSTVRAATQKEALSKVKTAVIETFDDDEEEELLLLFG